MSAKSSSPLHNKVIVITGASSGAGRATALEFARHKATLVLAARNEQALADIVEECEALGSKATFIRTDVTDAMDVKDLAAAAMAFGGKIDVWINNAGVLAIGELAETPVEIHAQVIRTNLIGYLYGAHAVLPYFKKQKEGILINNISIGGWLPVPYGTGYSASKFGLRGFSQALRGELNKFPKIHVCDLYPAFIDTPGVQHAANYTGVALRPAPPVYDPRCVARSMVRLLHRPKRTVMVGSVTPLLRLAQFISPALTRSITGYVISAYFKHAEPTAATSGNLFQPVNYGTTIYGGWTTPPGMTMRRKRTTAAAVIFAGAAAAFYLLTKTKQRS